MPLEKTIVASITRAATSMGWMVIKIHGGPFQNKGIPDLLCLREGRAVWLEVKQPGKKATPIQLAMMGRLAACGGTPSSVVTSEKEAREALLGASASWKQGTCGTSTASTTPRKSRSGSVR